MNLESRINHVEDSIKHFSKLLSDYNIEIEKLKKSIQPTNEDLYKNIRDYVTIRVISNQKYEHILGGDGRSQPWSEERIGTFANVKIKENVYLEDKQINIVKDYINNTEKVDIINIS